MLYFLIASRMVRADSEIRREGNNDGYLFNKFICYLPYFRCSSLYWNWHAYSSTNTIWSTKSGNSVVIKCLKWGDVFPVVFLKDVYNYLHLISVRRNRAKENRWSIGVTQIVTADVVGYERYRKYSPRLCRQNSRSASPRPHNRYPLFCYFHYHYLYSNSPAAEVKVLLSIKLLLYLHNPP